MAARNEPEGGDQPAQRQAATAPARRRSGRPRGETRTREDILAAARGEFHQYGFDRTTIRGIAASAGVDPALVHHYYGSKQDLFLAALQFPAEIPQLVHTVMAGGPEGAGERLVRFFLSIWDRSDTISPFMALLRSAISNPQATAMLREFVTDMVIGPATSQLAVDQRAIRAPLVASQMIGLAFARYVLELEPIRSASLETLVGTVGPTVQRYLTGPLPDSAECPDETAGSPTGSR
ncbi:TetR family transcriptional regulator [Fodinicola feengrottensis]|uniref:TetR family transcriptional regulator n=1 Tax=Fodinicola feengrottensis TaxID=435914 RepID=A0ABN2HQM8_9ACTN